MTEGSILVVAEQSDGIVDGVTWEALAAARRLSDADVALAVLGRDLENAVEEVSNKQVDTVLTIEHDLLEMYTADAYTLALQKVIDEQRPAVVVFAHTYRTRDFAPRLAARFSRSVISDCIHVERAGRGVKCVRQAFQGKILAEVVSNGYWPCFISVQAGAFPDDGAEGRGPARRIEKLDIVLSRDQIRTWPEAPIESGERTVDLTSARVIVAVGRGVKTSDQIDMARELAKTLGGELAGTRPVCDQGLLPLERQVGSSGQTVAPKLYVAIGISGATQHLVGMKGSERVIAINKDPGAPIFKIADYGVVGDLEEILPVLLDTLVPGRRAAEQPE